MDVLHIVSEIPTHFLIGAGIGVVLAFLWAAITVIATFFIFTGPPDTFDVDISDRAPKPRDKEDR